MKQSCSFKLIYCYQDPELNPLNSSYSMTGKATEISFTEYKIPAKERRKLAETNIYSNLDCKNEFSGSSIYFMFSR